MDPLPGPVEYNPVTHVNYSICVVDNNGWKVGFSDLKGWTGSASADGCSYRPLPAKYTWSTNMFCLCKKRFPCVEGMKGWKK